MFKDSKGKYGDKTSMVLSWWSLVLNPYKQIGGMGWGCVCVLVQFAYSHLHPTSELTKKIKHVYPKNMPRF